MIINIVYPSSAHRTGGVIVLYELANGLARRGNEVHFVHGPLTEHRITHLDELPAFEFDGRVRHHVVDTLEDPSLPRGDVVLVPSAPERLGLPVGIVQGFRMFTEEWERAAFCTSSPVVCVARWLVDVGLGFGVPSEQLWYVPLGMDHEIFTLRTPLDRREYDVVLLFHPHREKGFPVGLRAIEEARRRVPGLRALVFGMRKPPGPLPDWVDFLEAPDHRTLAVNGYNQSRILVQPSFHEGFGYTAVESMACGCALVTTDNGGSRDYALPGETAWVVPPGDVDGLATGIEALLRDDALRTRLATRGSEYARRFDWDSSAELLEAHLERYLAEPDAFRRPAGTSAREELG